MTVSSQISSDGKITTISISGRFDFNVYNNMREAYRTQNGSSTQYIIDLKNATYMDSSALGMLLQLREYAGDNRESIRVVNASPNIKCILNIANFNKLMIID